MDGTFCRPSRLSVVRGLPLIALAQHNVHNIMQITTLWKPLILYSLKFLANGSAPPGGDASAHGVPAPYGVCSDVVGVCVGGGASSGPGGS